MFVLGTQAIINLMTLLSALIILQIVLMIYLLFRLRSLSKSAGPTRSCDELQAKLKKYIKARINKKESLHSIKQKLLSAGWPQKTIDKAIKECK